MKTIIILFAVLLNINVSVAQSKPSIAIGYPLVTGLDIERSVASKILLLEIIKLQKYTVYDQFDMEDIYKNKPDLKENCLSKNCLVSLGQDLGVDFIISGSIDGLGNKIVITLKLIDVPNNQLAKSYVREFDNQEAEIQRMIQLLIYEMHDQEVDKVLSERLAFKNEVITSNNVGRINNSGPRIGLGAFTGSASEFARRPEGQGGLGIVPVVSMIGYQLEWQYVGTENFSALVETLFNVSGLEQGYFIPSISILNGFRFGKGGWEFAFGPGIGLKTTSKGFYDSEGLFGESNRYVSEKDWNNYVQNEFTQATHPEYYTQGFFDAPDPSDFNSQYNFDKTYADKRGKTSLSAMFVFAVGRTFKAGSLNIPVNVFYSSKKGGGLAGVSVGFNVAKSKKNINQEWK